MENMIQVFENKEFGKVRTVEENGKVMFVASDVAKALGYSRPADAVSAHCRCTVKHSIPHPQGKGTLTVNTIPEGDVYRLVTHSKLPAAEKFESWVFDEVLPAIRKTGTYSIPKDYPSALRALADQCECNQKLVAENQAMKPKALFADAVKSSKTSILVGELAKLIKQNGVEIGEKRLFTWLRDNGYLMSRKCSDWNMPTQKSMELGLFEINECNAFNPDGSVRITKTPRVTGKGQAYFINKFLSGKAA